MLHLVCLFATQNVNQMPSAKALLTVLPKAVNTTEHLASSLGPIPGSRRVQAVVTIAARLAFFPKIGQQADTAAVTGFGQGQQGVQLAPLDAFELVSRRAFIDHAALAIVGALLLVGSFAVAATGKPGTLYLDYFNSTQALHYLLAAGIALLALPRLSAQADASAPPA